MIDFLYKHFYYPYMFLSGIDFLLQERRETKRIKKEFGLKCVNFSIVSKVKKSDTLFIIGSGESINNLSSSQLHHIKKHDTFGFNYSISHELVPTYYSIECAGNKSMRDEQVSLLGTKRDEYSDTIVILKDIYEGLWPSVLPSVTDYFANLYYANEVQLVGRSVDDYFRALDIYRRLSMVKTGSLKNIPRKIGSVIFITFFAYLLGYKKIVLCGIDLNGGKHFYEDKKFEEFWKKIPKTLELIRNQTHHTIDQKANFVTMPEMIHALNEKILMPEGIELYVGSKISSLFPKLDLYSYT